MALIRQRPGFLRLLLLLVLIIVVVALLIARCGAPWERFGTTPTDCPAGTTLLAKFEWKGGTYKFEKPKGNEAIVFVTGTATGGTWTSTAPVNVVVLKGGQQTVATEYVPPVYAGTFTNETLPPNQNGKHPDISHIEFCGSSSPVTALTVMKIVDWNGATPDATTTFSVCIKGPSFPTVADCKTADFDGATLTWLNLIPGTYAITEPSPGSEWQVNLPPDILVLAGQVPTAELTNTYQQTQPTETPTPEPTATSTPEPTETPTPEPTATSTPAPTNTPTPEPTATGTPESTNTPTPEPTATSTPEPTNTPTAEPTATATLAAATQSAVEETPTPEPTATATLAAATQSAVEETPTPPVTASPGAVATATPDRGSDVEGEATPAPPGSGDSLLGGGWNARALLAVGICVAVFGLVGGAVVSRRRWQ